MRRMSWHRSLRTRLLLLMMSVVLCSWGIAIYWAYDEAKHEVTELFDANLAQTARALLGLVEHEYTENRLHRREILTNDVHHQGHKYEAKLAFLIRFPGDAVTFRSPNTPEFSANFPNGYCDEQYGRHHWRVFTMRTEGGIQVQTGERYDVRDETVTEILFSVLAPLQLSLPVLALLIWFSIGRSLRPLLAIAQEIAHRDPSRLQAVNAALVPLEVQPLTDALNQLLHRLAHAFENERRFTADASHELRTPLAGIKTQAEVAQRSQDERERTQALNQVIAGVTHATHLVEQLLALARMDAQASLVLEAVDLRALCVEMISDYTQAALAKNIDLGLDDQLSGAALIQGQVGGLYLMLRNLVDNALRYTPQDGTVTLLLREDAEASALLLCVLDNGPGIPVEDRAQVLERFHRGKHLHVSGSGLGLSIVLRIAELHGARLALDQAPGGGLSICVGFPLTSWQAAQTPAQSAD